MWKTVLRFGQWQNGIKDVVFGSRFSFTFLWYSKRTRNTRDVIIIYIHCNAIWEKAFVCNHFFVKFVFLCFAFHFFQSFKCTLPHHLAANTLETYPKKKQCKVWARNTHTLKPYTVVFIKGNPFKGKKTEKERTHVIKTKHPCKPFDEQRFKAKRTPQKIQNSAWLS